MTTTTETRPPFLQTILDERSPKGQAAKGGAYALDTSPKGDLYSVGFDGDGADIPSYYDIRAKQLEEFKEKAEHTESRITPNGALVDEYSTENALLLSVLQHNGLSYNVLLGKNKYFDYAVTTDGACIRTDKQNNSSMRSIKVEGNRWYKDVSDFTPSVTACTVATMREGKISTQIQKDGRIAIEAILGKAESHSFFIKTKHGAILTVDDNGSLIFADSKRLPKDIPEQDRAMHAQFETHPELIRDMIAPPIPIEQIKKEYGVTQHAVNNAAHILKRNGVTHSHNPPALSENHTTALTTKAAMHISARNSR